VKILVLSHQSNKSGAPRLLLNIFPKLNKEENVEVLFVLNKYQESAKEFIEKFNTEYFYIDKYKFARKIFLRLSLYNSTKLWWFKRILKNFNPDLVYINTTGYNLLAEYVSKKGFNYLVHVHETDDTITKHPNTAYLEALMKSASLIIGCSGYVSKFIQGKFNVYNVKTIYENIDIHRFSYKTDSSFRQLYNFSSSDVLVGVAGAPQFRKGTDLFIKAAILFNQRHPDNNFKFIWVGGTTHTNKNEYYKFCMLLIEKSGFNNIQLIDQIDDIQNLYSALDLFVIPSREDPFPLAMLEAMYFKVPVIGSSASGIPEALSDKCGIVFDSGNEQSLSDVFERFLEDKREFIKYSQNAYNKFVESYSTEAVYPDFKKTILKLRQN
jgi:glycosyltransferase involved in cell wall biosynthesis